MTRPLAVAALLAIAASSSAMPRFVTLAATIQAAEIALEAFDAEQQPVVVDVFNVVVSNSNDAPVTAVELNLRGPWVQGAATLRDTPDLLEMFGATFADTFFVAPPGVDFADVVLLDVTDTQGVLSASLTIRGDGVFIPAGGSAILATLSVPSGIDLDTLGIFDVTSFGVVDGVPECLGLLATVCVPEPAAGLLATLGAAGLVTRRRDSALRTRNSP